MPLTYYTANEYEALKKGLENNINTLCHTIKILRGEPCRQSGDAICCGGCDFHHYRDGGPKCTSSRKYLSK